MPRVGERGGMAGGAAEASPLRRSIPGSVFALAPRDVLTQARGAEARRARGRHHLWKLETPTPVGAILRPTGERGATALAGLVGRWDASHGTNSVSASRPFTHGMPTQSRTANPQERDWPSMSNGPRQSAVSTMSPSGFVRQDRCGGRRASTERSTSRRRDGSSPVVRLSPQPRARPPSGGAFA
jgi:hypothetical protein